MPIGSRSEIRTSTVPGRTRRIAASATQGEARSLRRLAARSSRTMLLPVRPSSSDTTSPRDILALPLTVMRVTVSAPEERAKAAA